MHSRSIRYLGAILASSAALTLLSAGGANAANYQKKFSTSVDGTTVSCTFTIPAPQPVRLKNQAMNLFVAMSAGTTLSCNRSFAIVSGRIRITKQITYANNKNQSTTDTMGIAGTMGLGADAANLTCTNWTSLVSGFYTSATSDLKVRFTKNGKTADLALSLPSTAKAQNTAVKGLLCTSALK